MVSRSSARKMEVAQWVAYGTWKQGCECFYIQRHSYRLQASQQVFLKGIARTSLGKLPAITRKISFLFDALVGAQQTKSANKYLKVDSECK